MAKKPKGTKTKKAKRGPAIVEEPIASDNTTGLETTTVDIDPDVPPDFSDDACADAFAAEFKDRLKFVRGKTWYAFDGCRWRESAEEAQHLARQALRIIARSIGTEAQARSIASRAKRDAILALAKSDPRLLVESKIFDQQHWLLNCPGGTIDLRTGEMMPHNPAHFLTRITAVDPQPIATPLWSAFLGDIFAGNEDLIGFMKRFFGYSFLGDPKEHCLLFAYGTGRNGKTTLFESVLNILGDYGATAAAEVFQASKNDRHPTELAELDGPRFVLAEEIKTGARWDEVRIKAFTGGGKITARFMGKDFFTYQPQFTPVIASNTKPKISTVDPAITARIKLVPFLVRFVDPEKIDDDQDPESEQQVIRKRDPDLKNKLKDEWAGILAWAIAGCREYQEMDGLAEPEIVKVTSQDYFDEEDLVGEFLDACCEYPPRDDKGRLTVSSKEANDYVATADALFQYWIQWAGDRNEFVNVQKVLTERIQGIADRKRIIYTKKANGHQRGFKRVRIDPNKYQAAMAALRPGAQSSTNASNGAHGADTGAENDPF